MSKYRGSSESPTILNPVGGGGPVMVVMTDVLPPPLTSEKVKSMPPSSPVPPFKGTETPLPAGVFGEQGAVSCRTIASPGGVSIRSRATVIVCVPGATHVRIGIPPSSWPVSGLSLLMPRDTELMTSGPPHSPPLGPYDHATYEVLPSG